MFSQKDDAKGMTVFLKIDDAGRSRSKRPKQKKDCAVRALAKVTNIPYDEAYKLLKEKAGRISGKGVQKDMFKRFLANNVINGYRFVWKSFQAIKGQDRVSCKTFSYLPESELAIVSCSKHVYASINGVAIDDSFEFNFNKCVYGCWILIKV